MRGCVLLNGLLMPWTTHHHPNVHNGLPDSIQHSLLNKNAHSRTSDDYFLGSGDKIRFFWEVGASFVV